MNKFFSDEEKKIMANLFKSLNRNLNEIYVLTFSNGDVVEAKVDTCYETDNGLENINYEEYHACAMRIEKVIVDTSKTLKKGNLIEINYHNYPYEIKTLQGHII